MSLHDRAMRELKAFFVLAAYLYVCLGALVLLKAAILHDVGASAPAWGTAALKALVLAKFMLVGEALHIGRAHDHRPLIYSTLYRSFVFFVFLLVLTMIEECLLGLYHGQSLAMSVSHAVQPTILQSLATCLIMFLILAPYFAFGGLNEALGQGVLRHLFFVERRIPK